MRIGFVFLLMCVFAFAEDGYPDDVKEYVPSQESSQIDNYVLGENSDILISVVGQGIAPAFATTPAQAYVLAKRAAMADAYRQLAERVKGVKIDGKDTIKNMAVKNSTINTQVQAMIKNATVVETTFKDGICEVEMEIKINYKNFKN